MKIIAKTFFVACLSLFVMACDSRQDAIEDLRMLVEDIRVNGGEYTAEQWADAEGIYEQVIEDLEQYEFTQGEKTEISKLKGEYMAAIAQWKVQEKFGVVKDLIEQATGAGKAIMENFAGAVEEKE